MGKEYHNYLAKLKMYLLHKPTIPQNDLSHAHTHTEEREKGYSMLHVYYSKRNQKIQMSISKKEDRLKQVFIRT